MARTSSPTATREALAQSVVTEAPARSAESIATELAPYLRGASDTFGACRVAFAGIEAGQTGQAIADAVTKVLATLMHPNEKSAAHRTALATSVSKGGAKVSRVAIDQRKNAWSDVVNAGITPTEDVVEKAYKLATTGGSAEPRARVVVAVAKLPEAKRAEAFIQKVEAALGALRQSNKERHSENAATRSADKKAEQVHQEIEVRDASAAEIAGYLRDLGKREWSDADKAILTDALADLSAAIA